MWRARRRGPGTPSTTTDANLDCAFVENALFYTDPWFWKVNRIELSLWPDLSRASLMCYDGQKPDHRKEKDRVNLKDVRLIETVSIRSGGGSDRCVWSRENFFLFGGWANSIWLGVSHSSMLARRVSFVWGYRTQTQAFFVRFKGNWKQDCVLTGKLEFFLMKLNFSAILRKL